MEPGLIAISAVVGYLLGSFPSAYVAGRVTIGVDIRAVGTGNVGALNTLHQIGPKAAIFVFLADVLKGSLAVLVAMGLSGSIWACFFAALAVVAGHNWPAFLGFRGGKGAATVLGVSLAFLPLLTLIALAPSVLLAWRTRNVVFAATVAFVVLNVLIVATGQDSVMILLCLMLAFVVSATYFAASWRQTIAALRQRRWVDLFSFE